MKNMEFRAWDGEQFLYLDLNNVEPDINIEWLLMFFRLPKQQYTGLQDKNGKEIYVGDIVELEHWKSSDIFNYDKPFIVEFLLGQVNFKQNRYNNFIGSLMGNLGIKVIGNIYENPELLEKL